ncbi:hypothetical protein SAMN05192563_100353 [Paraburkholderia aspalathi]|uniref:Uncharacterized protein n=1 Tax=Paraburkholderia aspalathi TaxID=1324617 RepID=A0A1I7A321_9BURK|nr:hypothetical protein SAMN05192563_100353 [Paraburkholderia aspalathi]
MSVPSLISTFPFGIARIAPDNKPHVLLKEKQGKPALPERPGSTLNRSHSIVNGLLNPCTAGPSATFVGTATVSDTVRSRSFPRRHGTDSTTLTKTTGSAALRSDSVSNSSCRAMRCARLSGTSFPITAKRNCLKRVADANAREELIGTRRRSICARYKRGIQRRRHRVATRCMLVQALNVDVSTS